MKRVAVLLCIWLAAWVALPARADFPDHALRIVVPFPAGGLTDVSIRKLAELASPDLGQPIVIESRPGANGALGTSQVIRANPDGYTLVMITTTTVLIAPVLGKTSYDPLKDLTLLLNFAGPSHALLVRADSKYQTLADLIADAKANPGKINFASVGTGDTVYFGISALGKAKGVSFTDVPYQGATQTMLAVLSGEVPFTASSAYYEYVRTGKLRALALLDKDRFAGLPGVPTFTELGIDWQFPWITGLAGPANMPVAVRQRLETAFLKAARDPRFAAFMASMNVPLYVLDGDALRADLSAKIPAYSRSAKELGILAN